MKKNAFILSMCILAFVLIFAGAFVIWKFTGNEQESDTEQESSEMTDDESLAYIPGALEDGPIQTPQPEVEKDYYNPEQTERKQNLGYELIVDEVIELQYEMPVYNPDSGIPYYQQTLLEDSDKLYQTLEAYVANYISEQNYKEDAWAVRTSAASDCAAMQGYTVTASTERLEFEFWTVVEENTPEGSCRLYVYRKVMQ